MGGFVKHGIVAPQVVGTRGLGSVQVRPVGILLPRGVVAEGDTCIAVTGR